MRKEKKFRFKDYLIELSKTTSVPKKEEVIDGITDFVIVKNDNDKEYNFIDLNYFPNLREIIIINFAINNFEFDILERCRKLKVIELIDCDITERGRREIEDARNSDIIVIENLNRERASQLVKFISLEELRNLYSKKKSTDYLSRVIKLKILNLTDSEYDKNLEAYLNNK